MTFVVQYRWRLVEGTEATFREAWCTMTEAIRKLHGTGGSRLHRADDGWYVAHAVWPDRAAWDRARGGPSADPAAGERMRACVAESSPPVLLDVLDDLTVR